MLKLTPTGASPLAICSRYVVSTTSAFQIVAPMTVDVGPTFGIEPGHRDDAVAGHAAVVDGEVADVGEALADAARAGRSLRTRSSRR